MCWIAKQPQKHRRSDIVHPRTIFQAEINRHDSMLIKVQATTDSNIAHSMHSGTIGAKPQASPPGFTTCSILNFPDDLEEVMNNFDNLDLNEFDNATSPTSKGMSCHDLRNRMEASFVSFSP